MIAPVNDLAPEGAVGPADRPRPAGRLLTVGIPVFNGKSLLRRCLQSVVDSSLPRDRFEIVVADDGSSAAETLDILYEFRLGLAAEPGFFRVLTSRTNSGGAARPRNQILDAATGDYVFFVDSDDRIGREALERIAAAVEATPADWVAVHQVPVNGRAAVARVRSPHTEVSRLKALTTLTVHKVFRRAEIERQRLRFDEGLPSGQDVSFAFSYLLNAQRFLMLGGYEYYYLTQHADDPSEPPHLSRRARTPVARIEKNERILRSMLEVLRRSDLSDEERRTIVGQVCLPRVLVRDRYLAAIVKAGPVAGTRALRRLAKLLADPVMAGVDPADIEGLTTEHLARIGRADWAGLAYLLGVATPQPRSALRLVTGLVVRARRVAGEVSGRARHREVVDELVRLRHSVDDLQKAHVRIEANLQAELQLRDMLAAGDRRPPAAAITPLNPGWQLSSRALHEVVRHVLQDRPEVVVECGSGASTMWIGRALRQAGAGRLISLESAADWVEIVGGLLEHEGLIAAEVRHAPLEPVRLAGSEQLWYPVSALADVAEIDCLLVDGPPSRTSPLARYPAVPALRTKLRPGATVMLDDCHRRDEKETLRRWLAEFPGLSLVRRVDRLAVLTMR